MDGQKNGGHLMSNSKYCPRRIITELILETAFRLIPVICAARRAWKLLEMTINSRQGLFRNKISNFSEINSCWRKFKGQHD